MTPRSVIIASFAAVGVVPDGVARVKWELANPGQHTPATVALSMAQVNRAFRP